MEESDDEGTPAGRRPLPFVGGPLPGAFRRRKVTLAPGEALPYVEADWRGALVIVERGELTLECRAGGQRRFGRDDILWMDGLGLRWLRNLGGDVAVVVAIMRRDPPAP